MVCSCSVHVFGVADLIHSVRSFNNCIHMHLVPYLKSQITPSANDEMNALQTQYSKFEPWRSQAEHATSQSWRLRCSTQYLRVSMVSRKEIFVILKPECQNGGRTRDLPTFQSDRFITTASVPLPKLLQLGVTNSKEILAKISVKKTKISQVLSKAMGSVLVLITPYDSVLANKTCAMLDFQIH